MLPAGTRQDRAEDVFGGLDTMLSCSWQKVGTKVSIEKKYKMLLLLYQYSIFLHRYLFI